MAEKREWLVKAYYKDEIKTRVVVAKDRREAEQIAMEIFDADCFMVSEIKD